MLHFFFVLFVNLRGEYETLKCPLEVDEEFGRCVHGNVLYCRESCDVHTRV